MTYPLRKRWAYAATLPAVEGDAHRSAIRAELAAELASPSTVETAAVALGCSTRILWDWIREWGVPRPGGMGGGHRAEEKIEPASIASCESPEKL